MFVKRILIALAGVILFSGVEARADNFVINGISGVVFIETSRDGGPPTLSLPPVLSLSGPGLSLTTDPLSGGADTGLVQARDICRTIVCVPGTVVATNSSFSGIIAIPNISTATVNGMFYDAVGLTGFLNFVSDPIVLPNVIGDLTVTIPFSFTGELTGNALGPGIVNPIFTATIGGQGLATFVFEMRSGPSGPQYVLSSIEYRFVPEPDAIILLSSGLSALIAGTQLRRRRRARRT